MARPPHPPGRLPAGLCIYGLTYLCGLTWAGTPRACRDPLSARGVVELAAEQGLSWVELPARMVEAGEESPADLRRFAEERGVRFVVPAGRVDAGDLERHLDLAALLGAPAVRCTLSGVLCGDRRGLPGGWRAHLKACVGALERVLPHAERLGVALAIENHQDADSDDLLALCRRFESPYLGVTLDTANPLAVMEEPIAFAERLAPYLRHAHLKDYRIHPAENGFRLVRCALGEGVIDFAALFALFDRQEWPVTRNIEMGALQARQVPILEPSWWDEYPPRDARAVLPALSVVWSRMRPAAEEWRTPWEQDAAGETLAEYERAQLRASIRHLREIEAGAAA